METNTTPSKGARITGWILTSLSALFFLVDGLMKVAKAATSMEGSTALGWPANLVVTIGILLAVFTILHLIPKTAVLGALLVTAYLGGAMSIMMAKGAPYFFPVIMGILMWTGFGLRDARIKTLFF